MKANELRIGNWIQSETAVFGPAKVRQWQVDIEDFFPIDSNPDNYEPIPLTEEWLLKFGFEYHNENGSKWFVKYPTDPYNDLNVSCERGEPYYLLFTNDEGDMVQRYIELKFVHQLQNLYFALTGEELEIK